MSHIVEAEANSVKMVTGKEPACGYRAGAHLVEPNDDMRGKRE
ncbi:hypothetical protein ACFLUG_02915 [Chloroflexota bacterium]